MMASLYATPPPDTPNATQATTTSTVTVDLNGEDASVLSDTSNSSQTNSSINSSSQNNNNNNNNGHKAPKRSILVTSPSTSANYPLLGNLFDTTPDLSKKRRKQTTPIRISAVAGGAFDLLQQTISNNNNNNNEQSINSNGLLTAASANDITEINDDEDENDIEDELDGNGLNSSSIIAATANGEIKDNEGNLQKIFLKNLSQLQAAAAANHQHLIANTNGNASEASMNDNLRVISHHHHQHQQQQQQLSPTAAAAAKILSATLSPLPPLNLNHNQNGQNNHNNEQQELSRQPHDFENEIEAEYHSKFMKNEKSPMGDKQQDKKEDSWLSLASLPFPFPPEAAAALSASGYLPQLPLLSSVGPFGSPDGVLARGAAPLRIFNPEAYCDLCNKEFCNKYFLKTHKANKHGIYEPMTPLGSNDMPTLNQLTQMQQMSQVLQMQQQQFNQAQQIAQQKMQQMVEPPPPPPQVNNNPVVNAPPPAPNAFCDICFKKFSSPAALKKHRLKIHEIGVVKSQQNSTSAPSSSSSSSSSVMPPQTQPVELTNKSNSNNNNNGSNDEQQMQIQHEINESMKEQQSQMQQQQQLPFNFPEGFREDFQIEQEDASFTPQPRKLSPELIQQAREANFAYDKLKRLGVINPEAFCELCCKEYCNKYFLRTHKLKRHGIFLPPDDIESGRALWPYIQTSPLNLIMGGDLKALQMYAKKQKEVEQQNDENIIKIPSPTASECGDEAMKEMTRKDEMEDEADDVRMNNSNSNGGKSPPSSPQVPQLTPQESEAISVDLQKLQSMILQLNELNQNRSLPCAICGKEMENQYMLHAHMLAEHSGFTNNNSIKLSPRPSSLPSPLPNEFEICKQCDKEFANIFQLKQHLMEQHGMPPMSPNTLRDGFITPERKASSGPQHILSQPSTPTQGDRKPMFQMTPTSSYCEICNKELCNKYFMKTHMQRMHGIEIENGAQIGGVVCNICNKELCSKYFLRVHKHNTHGIVEDGSPQQRPGSESIDSDNGFQMDLKPGEVSDQSNRYFSHFTEVCPLCSRRFRSAKWLKAHLMSDHGKAGVDKLNEIEAKIGPIKAPSPGLKIPNGGYGLASPDLMIKTQLGLFSGDNSMATSPGGSQNALKGYQCSFCSFSTPILAILFIHERSHQASNTAMNLIQNQNKSESAVSLAKELSNSQQPTPGISSPSSTPASTPIPSTPQESNSGKQMEMENFPPLMNPRPSVGLPQEAGPLVMQSFLLEESSMFSKSLVNGKTGTNDSYKFVPSMVILPVRERISSPITVSFTLTPA
ncbi:hypothetical protein PVAND_010435 [Polypedilum vanderplanki]|uniref:C2H2-type domain-containing protein n=1 Tax=Polypedilum vanderplanki TaxID=319348 RepID=A0A9J6CGK7_POLVA|nr:hypothetical protein PVAND_010435 [Polypedilum vanderplanki]